MNLFRKKKSSTCSCCKTNFSSEKMQNSKSGIKVLGSGCKKCAALEEAVKEALSSLGISEEIEHVTDFAQIASYGIMTTPALVIDGKVVSYGKVLNKDEAAALIKKARQ